jgi:hypothetical protein
MGNRPRLNLLEGMGEAIVLEPVLSELVSLSIKWSGEGAAVVSVLIILIGVRLAMKYHWLQSAPQDDSKSVLGKPERLSFEEWEYFEREEREALKSQDYDRWLRAVRRSR